MSVRTLAPWTCSNLNVRRRTQKGDTNFKSALKRRCHEKTLCWHSERDSEKRLMIKLVFTTCTLAITKSTLYKHHGRITAFTVEHSSNEEQTIGTVIKPCVKSIEWSHLARLQILSRNPATHRKGLRDPRYKGLPAMLQDARYAIRCHFLTNPVSSK